jgi:hypothetical protein
MKRCLHCHADVSSTPPGPQCPACGKPLAFGAASVRVGQLTKAGIVMTLLWVIVVNFIDRCQGERQREQLRNRPWMRSVDSLRVPTQETEDKVLPDSSENSRGGRKTP